VSYYEVETLSASEIKELAILIQSDFLNNKPRIISAVNKVFNNNEVVHSDYRNLKIDEYETEIRSRIKEFFKVMLSYIVRRRILLKINHSIFNDIVNFTIVEGRPAVDFITDDSIRNTFKTLEIEAFKEVS